MFSTGKTLMLHGLTHKSFTASLLSLLENNNVLQDCKSWLKWLQDHLLKWILSSLQYLLLAETFQDTAVTSLTRVYHVLHQKSLFSPVTVQQIHCLLAALHDYTSNICSFPCLNAGDWWKVILLVTQTEWTVCQECWELDLITNTIFPFLNSLPDH